MERLKEMLLSPAHDIHITDFNVRRKIVFDASENRWLCGTLKCTDITLVDTLTKALDTFNQ